MFPPGGGIEDLEAVYARSHTLLAYNTILCCVNTVKGEGGGGGGGGGEVLCPPSPFGKNTDACTDFLISDL